MASETSEAAHRYQTNVPCAMCGSSSHTAVGPHANPAAEARRTEWGVRFVRCNDCDLRFYSPRLAEDYVVSQFFSGDYARAQAASMADKAVLRGEPAGSAAEQIAHLRHYYLQVFRNLCGTYKEVNGRMPTSMFEVGASVGWFGKAVGEVAQEEGFPLRYAGCDANTYAAEIARERFGLAVQGRTVSGLNLSDTDLGAYDLLVAYDFIEHTYTPLEDLKRLRSMASPGAILTLKTFVEENDPEGRYVWPLEHVYHYTMKTLPELVRRAGWDIIEIDDKTSWSYSQVGIIARNGEAAVDAVPGRSDEAACAPALG